MGCATVASLLTQEGLDRYYRFQQERTAPVSLAARPSDLAWLDGLLKDAQRTAGDGAARIDVDIQGIRCSACVWLLRELFMRKPGALDALINPAVGRATLVFTSGVMDVAGYVRDIERFGYRAGAVGKRAESNGDGLLTRLGICVALTMNSMMFSLAHYLGLAPSDGDIFHVMRWLNLALSIAVLVVGGSEFISRALVGLKARRLSFDLPIGLGVTLAFAGSLYVFATNPASFSYFDTLNTFITLMLVGRWLQERVLESNRRALLADTGVDGLFARRIEGTTVQSVPATSLRAGDHVLVPPGGVLVADATLADDEGAFSLDWINGESLPRSYGRAEKVPAGAFNAHNQAARLTLACDFQQSSLQPLLQHAPGEDGSERDPLLLSRLTRFYVPAVLLSALAAFLMWLPAGLVRAVEVTTAVLVVTCPCALGIAIPLAYQRMAALLRRAGVFICRDGFLDRAVKVARVAFDKTGTLTLGTLRLTNPQDVHALDADLQRVLFNLTARSSHPRSRCIHDHIPAQHATFMELSVTEHAGRGLETTLADGRRIRLGAPTWLAGSPVNAPAEVWLGLGDTVAARFRLEEQLRWDARAELDALRAEGLGIQVLSGDAPERVQDVAAKLGLRDGEAVGALSPEGKAAWLRAHGADKDGLLIGDGVNDHPGFQVALACGTPAIDHPTLAARADFYFLTAGIGCVRTTLHAARRLRDVTRTIRNVALAYNALAVGLCMAGLVSPVTAAIAMPASSILIILYATRSTGSLPAVSRVASPAPVAEQDALVPT